MKITEARLKQIIAEEKAAVLSEGSKVRGAQNALQEIAMQSALLHDSDKLSTISEQDLKKIKVIAEYLDSIFYRTTNS
tara:strand:+ start:1474 stop:1707 length:234 start_codon:yes stop_codon:yes gene_type:complete